MIQFDPDEIPTFIQDLKLLGDDVAEAVLDELEFSASPMEWDEFVDTYGWDLLELDPHATYPGADPLYRVVVPLPAGMRPPHDKVSVFCKLYSNVVVVCAVAADYEPDDENA